MLQNWIDPTTLRSLRPTVSNDEVIDVVNKYRQDMLNEEKPIVSTKSLADYTKTEVVVEIINEMRKEDKAKKKVKF